jgi:hypothetical protein
MTSADRSKAPYAMSTHPVLLAAHVLLSIAFLRPEAARGERVVSYATSRQW